MHHGHMLHRPFVIGNSGMVARLRLVCLHQSFFWKPGGCNSASHFPEAAPHFPDIYLRKPTPHHPRLSSARGNDSVYIRPGIAAGFFDPDQLEAFLLNAFRRLVYTVAITKAANAKAYSHK